MRIEKLKITDFDKLMALQEKHIVHNLTPEEQSAQGFVTTRFTIDLLNALQKQDCSFVLYDDNTLGAYVLNGSWEFYKQWSIFEYMIERFKKLDTSVIFNDTQITVENSFQYGPVCIDNDFRGRGILKLLFDATLNEGSKNYKFLTTFINARNAISLAAHKKQTPLVQFDTFNFNNNTYYSFASRCEL